MDSQQVYDMTLRNLQLWKEIGQTLDTEEKNLHQQPSTTENQMSTM